MASIRELQQQLLQAHEFTRQLNAEIVNMKAEMVNMKTEVQEVNRKANWLDNDRVQKEQVIQQLQNHVAANAGGGSAPAPKSNGLVFLKTMMPKKFEGRADESFKTWAKSVYARIAIRTRLGSGSS